MIRLLKIWLGLAPKTQDTFDPMKKFLIVGLGNPGEKYAETRHNIGFKILDRMVEGTDATFETDKLGFKSAVSFKGRRLILIQPTTFMNLSGKAVRYWMEKENIPKENLLVVTDDLNLDFGTIRLKGKGSDGGHNGLKDIQDKLNGNKYPRLRFGIGDSFSKGRQVDYVLGEWSRQEQDTLLERIDLSCDAIRSFATAGLSNTMNQFNGK